MGVRVEVRLRNAVPGTLQGNGDAVDVDGPVAEEIPGDPAAAARMVALGSIIIVRALASGGSSSSSSTGGGEEVKTGRVRHH